MAKRKPKNLDAVMATGDVMLGLPVPRGATPDYREHRKLLEWKIERQRAYMSQSDSGTSQRLSRDAY